MANKQRTLEGINISDTEEIVPERGLLISEDYDCAHVFINGICGFCGRKEPCRFCQCDPCRCVPGE